MCFLKVALLLTGNELMTGDTVDSNSSRIAQSLALQGFDVAHKVTVGDDLALIVRELKILRIDTRSSLLTVVWAQPLMI